MRRQCVETCAKFTKLKKGCDKFDSVSTGSQTDVKSLHAGRESESHSSLQFVYCACRTSSIVVYLGILHIASQSAKSTGSSARVNCREL